MTHAQETKYTAATKDGRQPGAGAAGGRPATNPGPGGAPAPSPPCATEAPVRDLNHDFKELCRHNRDGSYATQADRAHILDLVANQLHEMGVRVTAAGSTGGGCGRWRRGSPKRRKVAKSVDAMEAVLHPRRPDRQRAARYRTSIGRPDPKKVQRGPGGGRLRRACKHLCMRAIHAEHFRPQGCAPC